MGSMLVIGLCWACGTMMTYSAERVPSIRVNGTRQPICQTCVDRANPTPCRQRPRPDHRPVRRLRRRRNPLTGQAVPRNPPRSWHPNRSSSTSTACWSACCATSSVIHPMGSAGVCEGSGPADLARSLLVDALADAAWCPHCGGSGRQVWDAEHRHLRSGRRTRRRPSLGRCIECHGERYGPAAGRYQQYKRDVIARLGDVWELTDGETLDRSLDQT